MTPFCSPDVAGSIDATGGVGALLQLTDHVLGESYVPTYDANGNVASLLNADPGSGAIVAKYEYSPFGELLRAEGAYAASNPFRFSTKFTDDESGLVYYGHRYYSPSLGRFINRDPIEEAGGLNLYGFCGNDGVNGRDYLGMDDVYVWSLPFAPWLLNWLFSPSVLTNDAPTRNTPSIADRSMQGLEVGVSRLPTEQPGISRRGSACCMLQFGATTEG